MQKSQSSMSEGSAVDSTFFKTNVIFALSLEMVMQSLFKNRPIALKLSSLFYMASMIIREARVKCFCLFIRTSFLPGGIAIFIEWF